ncbi:hypothetical protein ABES25_14730 [Bacillus gobiensis]|uniref:DUF4064 domain-containing protein n=1 Tax=Bacillus gobiensis TaxID=1441095 RepID=UPI003D1C0CB8
MNRSTEFILSLIASILLVLCLILTVFILLFFGTIAEGDANAAFWFIVLLISIFLNAPLIILVWVGTFFLKKDSLGWGIFILVMGILYSLSFYFVPGILLLIAGIMMLSRKNHSLEKSI